jgi:hypothetical protein
VSAAGERIGVSVYGRMGVWAYGRMGVPAHRRIGVGVWAFGVAQDSYDSPGFLETN